MHYELCIMNYELLIVIGASSGIGLEVAKQLIGQGWTVGVAARRLELLQAIGAAAVERIDVTEEEASEALPLSFLTFSSRFSLGRLYL